MESSSKETKWRWALYQPHFIN